MSVPTNLGLLVSATVDGPAGRVLTQGGNILYANKIPGVEPLLKYYTSGYILEDKLSKYLRGNGFAWNADSVRTAIDLSMRQGIIKPVGDEYRWTDDPNMAALWAAWERFDAGTIRMLLNRGVIDEQLGDSILRFSGWESRAERQALMDLRKVIPPPGQILDMALRGALRPDMLGPDGLGAEYQGAYDRWVRASGLTTVTLPQQAGDLDALTLNFPLALWALHWQMPTLAQWFEMRRRLRPSTADPNVSADPSGIIVPPERGPEIFRQNSIHPAWRDALTAVSYRPVSLRHLDLMYESGEIDRNGVADVLLDNGYAPSYARKVANARVWKIDRTRRRLVTSQSRAQIERAWELGAISDSDYLGWMQENDLSPDEARQALELARVEQHRKRLERLIRTLRQQTLTGQISINQANDKLVELGVESGRVAEYNADWRIELSGRRRILSARENLKATEEGLMSIDELTTRLRNLKYSEADIGIFVGELQLYLVERLAKAAAAAEKARQKGQRDAERAARMIQQAAAAARSALAKHGTPAKLKTWYCDGLISQTEVRERLRFLLWPDADIDRLLAECSVKSGSGKKP